MKRIDLRVGLPRVAAAWMALGAIALAGCYEAPDLRDPGPERVGPIFDPATSTVPLPNDAALSNGRLPTLPQAAAETAEGSFFTYLSFLSGWLPDTPIEIPFNGALDEDTIDGDSVRLYQVEGDDLTLLGSSTVYTGTESSSMIQVIPAAPLLPGNHYAVAVTKDILGANGHAIQEPLAIFFAGSRIPLVDERGDATIDLLADDRETAQSLEGLRQLLQPVFRGLEEEGLDRDDLAMVFRWNVVSDTVAVFDPDTATIPIPNTLALDPDGTFPTAGTCFAGQFSANGFFDDYISSLLGWPDTTPITLPLSGPIDESSLTGDAVQLWERRPGEQFERVDGLTVEYRTETTDNCTGEVSEHFHLLLVPDDGMQTHHEYFAVATRDIQTAAGRDLLPEIPVYLAMQPYPVVDGEGNSLVSVLGQEQAMGIAGVQQVLLPAMMALATVDLDHNDLASVWAWGTWSDAFVVFDPSTAQIPFPNEFLIEDGSVSLPIPADADPLTQGILTTLNQRPGFSVNAPGWIPVWGELDPETVNTQSVVLAPEDAAATQLFPEDAYEVHYDAALGHIIFDVRLPMQHNKQHVGIVTQDALGINGRPVQPTPAFVFLKSPHPLAVGGVSQVYALDDATATALESARGAYALLFTVASLIDNERFARRRISNAFAFSTEDPVRGLQEGRAVAQALVMSRAEQRVVRACEPDDCDDDPYLVEIEGGVVEDPEIADLTLDMSNVRAFHRGGEFATVDVMADTPGTGDNVGVTVYLPEMDQADGECVGPYDVVIAQHGLGGDRWQGGLAHANNLAAYPRCLATVSMDFPLHGGRSIGSTNLHPDARPVNSGQDFLTADLLAAKDNFVQGIIDLHVLTWLIQAGGLEGLFEDLDEDGPLFTDRVSYVGQSLGGILGTAFTALEPTVDTAVIAATGGRMTWILEGDDDGPSTIGAPILDAFGNLGIEAGSFDYIQTMALVQWVADWIDPVSFAPAAVQGTRQSLGFDGEGFVPVTAGTCSETPDCPFTFQCDSGTCVQYLSPVSYLVQMATGDRTIVNRATLLLADALGVSVEDTTFEAPHSFQVIRDPDQAGYEAAVCARHQAAAWITSGLAGDASLPANLTASACLD